MTHLTDLPAEILVVIGGFIRSLNSMRAAILTCRHLHQHLAPLLWKRITVSDQTYPFGAKADALKSHAHLVYRLNYAGYLDLGYYDISFPHLTSLMLLVSSEIEGRSPQELDTLWSRLLLLNPTVRDIDIFAFTRIYLKDFWDAVFTSLHYPRQLIIDGAQMHVAIDDEDTKAFWKACSRFEEIDYNGRDQAVTSWGFMNYDYSQLTRLRYNTVDFTFPGSAQVEWVGKCRSLRKLHWECEAGLIPLQRFTALAQNSTWPLLEDLCLGGTSGADEQFSAILQHLPSLKHWTLKSGDFGPTSIAQLRDRHFISLTTLRMPKVSTFTSRMALEVLSSCSQLEVFEARRISLEDFGLFPQPWACRRLRRLVVFFSMADNKDNNEANSLLFEQLSRLEQLEEIDVSQTTRYGSDYKLIYEPAPQWRLDHGLAQLSTLTRLWRLTCDSTKQDMRIEDVEWMLAHWPLLRRFSWLVSLDTHTQKLISAKLKKRGIFT
ncbi:hypothetical protein BG015_005767 [Linnemannia schmuckeri]|uniref:F-box domain-containing protein n=1 Tax=Linnemannia schmuckeri TaxID=64567 RepID=A0A9P5VCE7_9FUNG|nr:hypothetical protein BG015_005767 [Linnemannia schmuckeri]